MAQQPGQASMDMAAAANMRSRLTPRQKRLNRLWAFARVSEHDHKKYDWDGREIPTIDDTDAIVQTGYIPPGFVELGAGGTLPLKYRRPTAPLGVVRKIVGRFTGLLFSERRRPRISVTDDPDTEDFLAALIRQGRFWRVAIKARNYGGGMGTAILGFKFINGRIRFEAPDPRWCEPKFADPEEFILESLTIRHEEEKTVYDRDGSPLTKKFWYRRVVDAQEDRVWRDVEITAEEPDWDALSQDEEVCAAVTHGLGFCPFVWIQNLPNDDEIDGDPDAHGVYPLVEAADVLVAQAHRGTVANCFGEETRFVTAAGVRSFADFHDGEVVTVPSHTGTLRSATVRSYGRQQLYNITLTRGPCGAPVTVRATRNHRWLLADGTTSEHIEVGDRLLSAPDTFASFEYDTATEEERAAWRAGFVWGDGSVSRTPAGNECGSRVRLCGAKASYVGRFAVNGCTVTYPQHANYEPVVALHDTPKRLPDESAPAHLLRAFVRGYVDADGTKSIKKRSTRWRCIQATGDESVEFIRRVFPAVGLYITSETDLTAQRTNFGPRTACTVRFTLNECTSREDNSTWRVVSIVPDVHDTVWCLSVEEDSSFVLPCGLSTRNCDPTLFVSSDDELGTVAKGSDNAIKLGSGSSVSYLELQGTSADAAWRQAEKLEERAYRLARCVSDDVLARSDVPRTATEIVSLFADMLEQAEMLRDQYGPALELLFEMVELAVRTLQEPQIVNGVAQRAIIQLPDRMVTQDGETFRSPRELGPGGDLVAVWGPFSKPPMTDVETAVRTMNDATMNSFVSKKHAMRFLASYLDYSDPAAMQREIDEEAAAETAKEEEETPAEGEDAAEGGEDTSADTGTDPKLFQFTVEEAKIGLCTLNEYRQGRGCGALPDGDLTLPQYMAKHPEVFIAATAVVSTEAGKAFFNVEESAENPPQLSPNPEPGPPVEYAPAEDENEPEEEEAPPEEDEDVEGASDEDALDDEQEPEDADVSGP